MKENKREEPATCSEPCNANRGTRPLTDLQERWELCRKGRKVTVVQAGLRIAQLDSAGSLS